MELNQLETFLAVAEERSFSRAATRLHRTQPAVSQVIRKLEASVGETLFDRAARDGALTAAGTLLRDYALRLLALRREAASALDELKSLERGHLQLAANEYTCMYLLPAIDAFRREYPHIDVTVQRMLASNIPEELNRRTFELGVISFRPDPAQIRTIAVYNDSLDFIVSPSHPLAGAERVAIRDLGEENFIAHNVASPLRRKVIEAFQQHRTPLHMGIELPTIEAIKRFVAMGNGVAGRPGARAGRRPGGAPRTAPRDPAAGLALLRRQSLSGHTQEPGRQAGAAFFLPRGARETRIKGTKKQEVRSSQ
jgi:DNA-binding transcriptional LysR family regulator